MNRIVVPLLSSARAPVGGTGPDPRSPVRRTGGPGFDSVVRRVPARPAVNAPERPDRNSVADRGGQS